MFRFTIRDVLWLMVVVAVATAMGAGWWRDHKAAKDVAFYRERLITFGKVLQQTITAIEKEGYKWRATLDNVELDPVQTTEPNSNAGEARS